MLVFDIDLVEFFYTFNIVVCHFIIRSRLVIIIFIGIVVKFGVKRIGFFNNFWYIFDVNSIH